MLIDTHAHLNFRAYKNDADEVIQRSLDRGVFMINVGSQYSTSVRALEYAKKYETGVWAVIGIHPLHLQAQKFSYHDPDEIEEVEIETAGEVFQKEKYLELAKDEKVVAIGEVGLDYHHFEEGDDREKLIAKQKEIFLEFIKLANEVKKPIMIHAWGVKSRKELDHARADAYDDLYEILEKNPVEKRGVIHSFVGSYKTAKKFVELGYLIGLNGIVTYGISYDKLIREIDLKDIVIETDCPYLTPVPKKGERNEPLNVELVAKKIAEVKEISMEEVACETTKNAKKLFEI
jgi:TatD DNase family protein